MQLMRSIDYPETMTYDAVLLDFDGVVVELPDVDGLREAVAGACRRVGIEDAIDEATAALQRGNVRTLFDRCRSAGVRPDRFRASAAAAVANAQLRQAEEGLRRAYDDVSVLRDLDQPVAVVTNNHPHAAEYLLDWFGLSDQVTLVKGCRFTEEGFERRKPNPDNLIEATDDLGAENPLAVGDQPYDVAAADRAGIDSALVEREPETGRVDPLSTESATAVDPTYRLDTLAELRSVL